MKIMELVEGDSIILSDPLTSNSRRLQAALELLEQVLVRSAPTFLGRSPHASIFLLAGRNSLVNPFWGDELIFDSRTLFEGNLCIRGLRDKPEGGRAARFRGRRTRQSNGGDEVSPRFR